MDAEGEERTIGAAYETDQRAIKTFMKWIPDNWLPRKQEPDFFVDYVIKVVELGEPTGKHFGSQVKGTTTLDTQGKIAYRFLTKHLRYYLNRCHHPVFLFLIDVDSGEGWWVFAQKYLKERFTQDELGRRKRLTITFDKADSLSAKERFQSAFLHASEYAQNLHPGSVEAALDKKRKELEAKDPRLAVSIVASHGKQHITLSPKEPIHLRAKFRIDEGVASAWRDLIERGTTLRLKSCHFELEGSPLLEEFMRQGPGELTLESPHRHPGRLLVEPEFGDGTEIFNLSGTWNSGQKFLTFDAELPDTPIQIHFEVEFEAISRGEFGIFTVHYRPCEWDELPLLGLPRFQEVKRLVSVLTNPKGASVQLFDRDQRLVRGTFGPLVDSDFKAVSWQLEWLSKARAVASQLGISPTLPKDGEISDRQYESVEDAFALLRDGNVKKPMPNIRLEMTVTRPPQELAGQNLHQGGWLRMGAENDSFDFFGCPVLRGQVRREWSCMRAVVLEPSPCGGSRLVFEGEDDTICILTKTPKA